MLTSINVRVRRILFLIATITVYALVLPPEVRSLVASFAVGWCLYDLADSLFRD